VPHKRASRKKESAEGESRVRPFWSGTLTFGLVSVPVNLLSALWCKFRIVHSIRFDAHRVF